MFGNIGPTELLLVGLVLFLLFGGQKLPELTRSLINAIKEFRIAFKEGEASSDKKDNQ